MFTFVKAFSLVLFLSSILFSQELSRFERIEKLKTISTELEHTKNKVEQMESEQEALLDGLTSVDEIDVVQAGRLGVEYERLFPDEILDSAEIERTSFSKYRFADDFDYYFSPSMFFKNGKFEIDFDKTSEINSYGLIVNIGGTLIEAIDKENKTVKAINKYKPPKRAKDFTGDFTEEGITFLTKANVAVGNTYIVRVFQHEVASAIYAVKVHKKDDDGSIVIFIKSIDFYKLPISGQNNQTITQKQPYEISDAELYTNIQNVMNQKGFYNVRVDVKDGVVILRGSVPRGKLGIAVMSANAAKPRKVENQLTEEKQ